MGLRYGVIGKKGGCPSWMRGSVGRTIRSGLGSFLLWGGSCELRRRMEKSMMIFLVRLSSLSASHSSHVEFISAPDRMGKIAKFNSDAYAVLEATTAQGESSFPIAATELNLLS